MIMVVMSVGITNTDVTVLEVTHNGSAVGKHFVRSHDKPNGTTFGLTNLKVLLTQILTLGLDIIQHRRLDEFLGQFLPRTQFGPPE